MRTAVPRLATGIVAAAALVVAAVMGSSSPAKPTTTVVAPTLAAATSSSCRPTTVHPYPVVLVHGTFENQTWMSTIGAALTRAGFCVSSFNYGCQNGQQLICATGPIEDSARQLSTFVDAVLAATGAAQVDLVGHSQGGMMPRQYLKFLGGAARVHRLIGLAPSNHGTTLNGLSTLAGLVLGVTPLCDACVEQLAGSSFLANLNEGGDTVPGVQYTVIETRYDEVVTPFTSAFLSGPSVTNILLQSSCPPDTTGHVGILADPNAIGWVLHALDPTVPAPGCTPYVAPL